jgi:hypothetical protein
MVSWCEANAESVCCLALAALIPLEVFAGAGMDTE